MCGCGKRHNNKIPTTNRYRDDLLPSSIYYHRKRKVCRSDIKCIYGDSDCCNKFIEHAPQSAYHWRPMIRLDDIPSSIPDHLRKAKLDLAYDNCERYYKVEKKCYVVKKDCH